MIFQLQKDFTLIGKTIIKPERSFSFNAYLLTGEKNVLIDTVPEKVSEVFWKELEAILPIEKLYALILNHSEEDHSGALPYLLQTRPDMPIYCTASCAGRLSKTYPNTKNWQTIKSGEKLFLGEKIFSFVETPGLHWDDNMVTYWENERVLFSNDLFGQYVGSNLPLDSEFHPAILESATRTYFDKVFSAATQEEKQIILKLTELPIKYIATGHGVVIKDRIDEMFQWYKEMI